MIDIFIKSYRNDFMLLNYCLKSIEKHLKGYGEIHIVIPAQDNQAFIDNVHSELPIKLHFVKEYGNGYLYQQLCKMTAYKYCTNQFIMFVDSDCIFYKPIDLGSYIKNDKPEILYTHYSKVGDAICWKEPTEKFINGSVQFEYMRRFPLTYHRDTLEKIHTLEPNLENIIMRSNRFSEFNAIGAWAYLNEPDKYAFENTDNWQYIDPIAVQLWSHFHNKGNELQQTEYKRALDTINKALDLNLTELINSHKLLTNNI